MDIHLKNHKSYFVDQVSRNSQPKIILFKRLKVWLIIIVNQSITSILKNTFDPHKKYINLIICHYIKIIHKI